MRSETVPSRDYTSPALKLLYEPTGEMLTLTEIAKVAGVRGTRLRERWTRAGRPRTITSALARPPGASKDRIYVEYPPHGRVCFKQIQQIHKHMGMSLQFFRERWRKAGRPDVVTREMFHCEVRERAKQPLPVPSDPRYLDDSRWSPDVPFADLCHLSGDGNTGAGRGAISDEEWLAAKVARPKSSLTGLSRLRASGEESGALVAALERFETALRREIEAGRMQGGAPIYTGR